MNFLFIICLKKAMITYNVVIAFYIFLEDLMTKIYFNHDGGVDDLISLFLLLQMDNVELVGVSTIGADCYLEPSLSASCKIINRFSNLSIDVAPSYERGVNPFPKDWRMHAFLWMRCLF